MPSRIIIKMNIILNTKLNYTMLSINRSPVSIFSIFHGVFSVNPHITFIRYTVLHSIRYIYNIVIMGGTSRDFPNN